MNVKSCAVRNTGVMNNTRTPLRLVGSTWVMGRLGISRPTLIRRVQDGDIRPLASPPDVPGHVFDRMDVEAYALRVQRLASKRGAR